MGKLSGTGTGHANDYTILTMIGDILVDIGSALAGKK